MYKNELNDFLVRKNKYETEFIKGDYSEAENNLNEIEDLFGVSLWLLENRIALIGKSKGFEDMKHYTGTIENDENINGLLRYLTRYISVRAEENMSSERYRSIVRKVVAELHSRHLEDVATYVQFRLDRFGEIQNDHLAFILYSESDSSIIDRYLTFVYICQYVCSYDVLVKSNESVSNAVSLLLGNICDTRIDKLGYFLGLVDAVLVDPLYIRVVNALDLYTSGAYQDCKKLCTELLTLNPERVELIELLVKCSIRLNTYVVPIGPASALNTIMSCMSDLSSKSGRALQSFYELYKLIQANPDHFWSSQLYAFISKEMNYSQSVGLRQIELFGELNSHPHNPRISLFMTDIFQMKSFIEKLKICYKSDITCSLYEALCTNDVAKLDNLSNEGKIPEDRIIRYKAVALTNIGQSIVAIQLLEPLFNTPDRILHQDIVDGLTRCYIEINDFKMCLDMIANCYLRNQSMFVKFPVGDIIKSAELLKSPEITSDISLTITLNIYSQYFSSDKDYMLPLAYEAFLINNNLSKPSEIRSRMDQFETIKLIYFLRYVCIPQIMDSSIVFSNTEDIENERIAVCQLLGVLDPDNGKIYSEEITRIIQNQMINKEIRAVEESKIYVDIQGIKKIYEKTGKENFSRYLTFLSSPMSGEDNLDDLVIKLQKLFEETGEHVEIFKVPKSEKFNLFASMVLELRDDFVSSDEYGLDGYLSVRIRHGTLSGQLRSPLESAFLITQKDDETDVYYQNDYWRKEYHNVANDITNNIIKRLADFSREIDGLIGRLKNTWIQVRTEKKNPEGLFDFSLGLREIQKFEPKIMVTTTYEEFVDLILNELWKMTDNNLEIIRNRISNDLKSLFNDAFDNLQRDFNEIKQNVNLTTLDAALARSRTIIQDELDKIASWFTRSESGETGDYAFELPIRIALAMTNNAYPNRKINPEIITEEGTLRGNTLKVFVDIMFMLFDNIVKHSGYQNEQPVIKLSLLNQNNFITIHVENDVHKSINILEEAGKLEILKETLSKAASLEQVRKEGGTGFYKIRKMIEYDLGCKHEMEFGFTSNNKFRFETRIPAENIISKG